MRTQEQAPRYRWVILLVNFLFLTFAYAGLSAWSIAVPQLAKTFSLTQTQTQLGACALMAGYAVGSYVEALLAARIGAKKTGLLAAALLLAPQFSIPHVESYSLIVFLRFIQGWGIVWFVTVAMTTAWFPLKERGLASGVIGGGIPAGIGIGGILSAWLLERAGNNWQQAFTQFGCLVLAVVVVWVILARDAPAGLYARAKEEAGEKEPGARVNPFTLAAGWLIALALFVNAFQLVGFTSILPNYMYGLAYDASQAGTAVLLCGLVGVLSTPLGGIISDSLAAKGMSPIKARAYVMAIPGFLVTAAATVAFPHIAQNGYGPLLFMVVLVGWGVPLTNASIGALPMDMLKDPNVAGKLFGMTILIGLMGAVAAPFAAASVSESAGWTAAFTLLGAAAFAGVILGLIIPRFQK